MRPPSRIKSRSHPKNEEVGLVACELVSADQFAELKRRYEMQHKPVEFLHV